MPEPTKGLFQYPKLNLSYSLHHSISQVSAEWDKLAPSQTLSTALLKGIENAPPVGMHFLYGQFYDTSHRLIGGAYFQVNYFSARSSLKNQKKSPDAELAERLDSPCFFQGIHDLVKKYVSRKAEFYTLTCGNLLLTGEHGYFFDRSLVAESAVFDLLSAAMKQARKILEKERGIKCQMYLFKEFYEGTKKNTAKLLENSYHEFCAQPNMVMNLQPNWRCMEDYLSDLQSKYRVRAKSAFKKGAVLQTRILSLEELTDYQEQIYALYEGISEKAGFNAVELHKYYFGALKTELPNDFTVHGYFLNNDLVAFRSSILNKSQLEAHFVGYSPIHNHPHQLYLNMLFDYIEEGLDKGCQRIIFARTALEIKSSVGAEAYEMYCYVRHKRSLINQLISKALDYILPKEEWQPRSPFKTAKEEMSAVEKA